MKRSKKKTFTFIVAFRGGTYCTQVQAENVNKSILQWLNKIEIEQDQIQYLGNKVLEELKTMAKDDDDKPVPLIGLKNVWYTHYTTRKGSFGINIVQTDI